MNGEWVYGKAWMKGNGATSSFHVPAPPEPGTICPTCENRTPNKNALRQRAWRAKRKLKAHAEGSRISGGTGEKLNE